jgi:hypothetical protein
MYLSSLKIKKNIDSAFFIQKNFIRVVFYIQNIIYLCNRLCVVSDVKYNFSC